MLKNTKTKISGITTLILPILPFLYGLNSDITLAAGNNATGIKKVMENFVNFLLDTFIGFLIILSIAIFLFNSVRFFIIDSANEEGRSKAKRFAIYGLMALFIISIFIPLVKLLVNSLNFGSNDKITENYIQRKASSNNNTTTDNGSDSNNSNNNSNSQSNTNNNQNNNNSGSNNNNNTTSNQNNNSQSGNTFNPWGSNNILSDE